MSIERDFNDEETCKFYAGFARYLYKSIKNFDTLSKLKQELHDAPAEVKASFNEVVKYFDGRIRGIDPAMVRHGHDILEDCERKGTHYDPIKVLMKEIPGCSKEVAEFIAGSF